MNPASIGDYAVLGDGQTVALVSREGDLDWLCWPRIDSGSIFGRLLDPAGGTFSVRPDGPLEPHCRYLDETNVLLTTWSGADAQVEVTDWMPALREEDRPGRCLPRTSVVRVVRCVRGAASINVFFDPRPDYGRREARVVDRGRLGHQVDVGRGCLSLTSSRRLAFADGKAVLRLEAGEQLALALAWSSDAPEVIADATDLATETFEPTVRWWRSFASSVQYDGPYRAQVVRSALALKLLIYAPSSALVAAGTTSLPERMGGELNWDYRFSWARDASLTVRALEALGFEKEADAYVSWMLHSSRLTRPRLAVLYDVFGRPPAEEEELGGWEGFNGSRPVRIRNGASTQLQLDSYGEVIDAVAHVVRRGRGLDRETVGMLRDFGEYVCRQWERPDAGIWEVRGPPRHYTHSKLLCWVALERLLEIDRRQKLRRFPRELFEKNRRMLREAIETRGWNPELQSYTQTFEGDQLDASLLLMSWYGFEDAGSPRMRGTARALLRRLSPGPGLIYRYDQSLEAKEGAFAICGFWFAEYLARGGGPLEQAERFFQEAARFANDFGLLAEEVDPRTGDLLGNFPQAFSHVGLIGAALAIDERRRSSGTRRERLRMDQEVQR